MTLKSSIKILIGLGVFFLINHPSPVLAQCSGLDALTCPKTSGCTFTGNYCITTSSLPAYSFSASADSFIKTIGLNKTLTSFSGIINAIIPLTIVFAGLILFFMLISGGFQLLTSASNPEAADKGKQRITTALIGFIIIFAAYWITEIVQIILGVNILK